MSQVKKWEQVVAPVAPCAEGNKDVTQIVTWWTWRDGSVLDTNHTELTHSSYFPKLMPLLGPSACSCGWTFCLIQRCARRAPCAIAIVEIWSCHARAHVREATSSMCPASGMHAAADTGSEEGREKERRGGGVRFGGLVTHSSSQTTTYLRFEWKARRRERGERERERGEGERERASNPLSPN